MHWLRLCKLCSLWRSVHGRREVRWCDLAGALDLDCTLGPPGELKKYGRPLLSIELRVVLRATGFSSIARVKSYAVDAWFPTVMFHISCFAMKPLRFFYQQKHNPGRFLSRNQSRRSLKHTPITAKRPFDKICFLSFFFFNIWSCFPLSRPFVAFKKGPSQRRTNLDTESIHFLCQQMPSGSFSAKQGCVVQHVHTREQPWAEG